MSLGTGDRGRGSSSLEDLYRTSPETVRASYDEASARPAHAPFLKFVASVVRPPRTLLDVGCGDGWSTWLFAEAGFEATGVDVHRAFGAPGHERCKLLTASALALPFDSDTYDVVATHQMIEHVPEPEQALREMLRVLRPGGVLVVVGPNLLSLGMPVRGAVQWVWRNRPLRRVFLRDASMPVHPFGNTLPECLAAFARNAWLLARKAVSAEAAFIPREPDLRPPFHADNDACWYCNGIDISRYLQKAGCSVLRAWPDRRGRVASLFAGGMYLAARKGG